MSITNFRIFNENYIDENVLADYTGSSENSSYVVENIFNFQRRSKVWRSNGYWTIDSSNRLLNFRETTGVDLYALLNTGTYNSTSFMAEIARALNSAGASLYTVSQNNLRFEIVSNLAGGGGIFEIYVAGSTIAFKLGLTSDKTGSASYIFDDISITQEEFVIFDLGVATNPDAFIMCDQRNQPIQISPTATVKLEGNETNNFSTPSFTTTLTHDDEVYSHLTDSGISTDPYRFWRISFDAEASMPNGYVQLGAIFLGNYISPTRARAQFPLRNKYIDNTVTVFSEGGASFSDLKETSASYGIQIKGLYKAEVEEFDTFFETYKTGKPFFISMDTGEVWSTNKNRRIVLCKLVSEPTWELIASDYFILNFEIREEL